ncbi:3-hexulose-6-phosphate synthase, partial [Xanthomonas citri pv. citri]|nr:3-hexulose-6-phosphate synthase [Xanthomonas citri pv. citri]
GITSAADKAETASKMKQLIVQG